MNVILLSDIFFSVSTNQIPKNQEQEYTQTHTRMQTYTEKGIPIKTSSPSDPVSSLEPALLRLELKIFGMTNCIKLYAWKQIIKLIMATVF